MKILSFSWMAQNDLLLPWLNVLENITLGQKLRREKIDLHKANLLLEKVGLIDVAKQLPSTIFRRNETKSSLSKNFNGKQ